MATQTTTFDESVPKHIEWVGALYCRETMQQFEWRTGTVECPHCGAVFENSAPQQNGTQHSGGN